MRILTWNINGIRTIPQYHPWNTLKTQEEILDYLNADIICFQEMKSSRKGLTKDIAVPNSYDTFFSFPAKKSGYSGVATYTRVVPRKAEEGLSGLLDLKPPLTLSERISTTYPYQSHLASQVDLRELDNEGRVVVLDFGPFVLINVYCPNDGTEAEDRIQYKIDFQRVLEERVRTLIQVEKRQVIVVGDLNACAALVDHCEGPLLAKKLGLDSQGREAEDAFWNEKQCRMWLRSWLVEGGGPMVDIVRRQWPDRKDMFTCWNTKISARASNYGTRIDYILITPGLLPYVKHADIQPDVKGSDHCPVFLDLDDSIFADSPMTSREWRPRKQRVLGDFFGKKGDEPKPKASSSQSSLQSNAPAPQLKVSSSTSTNKRKAPETTSSSSKKTKQTPSQGKLSSFFNNSSKAAPHKAASPAEDDDEDYRLALELSRQPSSPPPVPDRQSSKKWKSLLAPVPPPRCTVHNEPAKELTTKQGVNKGKMFFICSRPVGPGYDKGREERARADVNPEYRCNFFKWSSDVRREAMREAE
ncbi:DNase I-like protein [Hymenopellis radicata]|nr:DNase I-like protein [Hymenopellis radicata]